MKTLVSLFPKQLIAGEDLITMCSIYSKNNLEYHIFYRVREHRIQTEVHALDSALYVAGFERIKVGRVSERTELLIRGKIGAINFNIGRTIEKTIVGYDKDGEWHTQFVRNEGQVALHAFYSRMAYEDGAVNINK